MASVFSFVNGVVFRKSIQKNIFLTLLSVCLFSDYVAAAESESVKDEITVEQVDSSDAMSVPKVSSINATTKVKKKLFPGSWSSTLDYTYMSFKGTQAATDGTSELYDFDDVQVDLQSFTLKYSPSPLVSYSLVATHQVNYAETKFYGQWYSDRTQGISDTLLKRTEVFVLPKQQMIILDVGLYLPTGSIDEKNQSAPAYNYPYNMQLGSGTFDPMVMAMYLKTFGTKHQLGGFGLARIRTGETNKNDYHLGNDWTTAIWYSYLLNQYLTPGIKLNYRSIEGLSGLDPLIPDMREMHFYYNTRAFWDLTPTLTAKYPIGKNVSLQAMVGVPVWQRFSNIDSVEVSTRWYGQFGITVQ